MLFVQFNNGLVVLVHNRDIRRLLPRRQGRAALLRGDQLLFQLVTRRLRFIPLVALGAMSLSLAAARKYILDAQGLLRICRGRGAVLVRILIVHLFENLYSIYNIIKLFFGNFELFE